MMRRLRFVLLAFLAVMYTSAAAEQTTLTAVVPDTHTIVLNVEGCGAASADGEPIAGEKTFAVERFGSLVIEHEADWGYRLGNVKASSAVNVSFEESRIILSPVVQDVYLDLAFVALDEPVMRLNRDGVTLEEGMATVLQTEIGPPPEEPMAVRWSSSDEAVASVDETGKITAHRNGEAVITAVCGSMRSDCAVQVREMKTVTFPTQLKVIADGAMQDNQTAEMVRFPDVAEKIGKDVFAGCSQLQWVWLPASIQEIGEGAFEGCSKLTLICEEGAQVPIAYAESHGIPYLTY